MLYSYVTIVNRVARKEKPMPAHDPIFQAQQDYREGEGQAANPYREGTDQHSDYAWEMHRLQHNELAEMMGVLQQ